MNLVKQLNIRQRLYLAFFSTLLVLILLSGWQYRNLSQQSDTVAKMYNHPLTVTRASYASFSTLLEIKAEVYQARSEPNPDQYRRQIERLFADIHQQLNTVDERILGAEGVQLAKDTRAQVRAWQPMVFAEISGNATDNTYAEALGQLEKRFQALIAYAKNKADGFYANSAQSSERTANITIFVIAATAILVAFLANLTIRGITAPLSRMRDVMASIASSLNLSNRMPVPGNCEVSDTAKAFNGMIETIEQAISDTKNSSDSMVLQCNTVESLTAALKQAVTEQQQDITHVVDAIHEVDQMVAHIANNAAQAAEAVESCRDSAQQGHDMVSKVIANQTKLNADSKATVALIDQLNKDADKIGSVLSVIFDVAEQTNLLALNAAIEAARAGEHGRGFAVVAEEVRTLAQRTESSTQEIRQTIEDVQRGTGEAVGVINSNAQKVAENYAMTQQAGTMLQEILSAVEDLTERNHAMAQATENQLAANRDIQTRVQRVSQHSQETERSSSEVTNTNQHLIDIGRSLSKIVDRFEIIPQSTATS